MTDLPQHATQVFFFLNRHNTELGYDKLFYVNWLTPYSLGLLISCGFAQFFSILISVKLTLVFSLVATFYFSFKLLEELGGDTFWSLLVFPLFFGYSFYWGFFPFISAYPFALLYLFSGIRYFKNPHSINGVIFFIASLLVFFGHMLLFLFSFAVLCGFYLRFFKKETLITHVNKLCVFALPALFFSLIFFINKSKDPSSIGGIEWRTNPIIKLLELLVFSNNSQLHHITLFMSLLGLITITLSSEKKEKNINNFYPFIGAILIFIFTPNSYFGVYFLYQRFSSLTALIFIFCLSETSVVSYKKISQILVIFIVTVSCFFLHYQCIAYNREAKEIDPILEKIPKNQKIAPLIFSTEMRMASSEARHLPCWYIVEKGGQIRFSFSTLGYSLIRYKKHLNYFQLERLGFTNNNPLYILPKELEEFTYVIGRSNSDISNSSILKDFQLIETSGNWFLFKNTKIDNLNS
ncbi:MAG: hypothetical protein ACKVQC_03165 [Elusimicrobiota bacterium]